jgi:hypothetical protein
MSNGDTRAAEITEAQRLREQGLTHREIGERLGIPRATVWGMLNPDTARASRRKYNRAHKPPPRCADCGGPRSQGSTRCHRCFVARRAKRHNQVLAWRAEAFEAVWRDGGGMGELAEVFGWSLDRVRAEMGRMRERGADLPYRDQAGGARGRKHPHLRETIGTES